LKGRKEFAMPFALPPLVAVALAMAGGAMLARLIRKEWQRVNAELHSSAARAEEDRDRLPKLKPDPETGIYRTE
jgi:hypothetical protein